MLRRHRVVPSGAPVECEPTALSGTWRGCWNQRPVFSVAQPFAQEMVFDAAGGVTGSGADSNGELYQIAGTVWRDAAVTRLRWTKSYLRLPDQVEYDGVLVGGTVAGHFTHCRRRGLRGTFAMAQRGTIPAAARLSAGAVLFAAVSLVAFVSAMVLVCTTSSWVGSAVMLFSSIMQLAGFVVPDRLLAGSRRQQALLATGDSEPRKLPPARLLPTRR
jgi:hypothetical protein